MSHRLWNATTLWVASLMLAGGVVVASAILFIQTATEDIRTLNRDTLARLHQVTDVLADAMASGRDQQTALAFPDDTIRFDAIQRSTARAEDAVRGATMYAALLTDPADTERWASIRADLVDVVARRTALFDLLIAGDEAAARAMGTTIAPRMSAVDAALGAEIDRLFGDDVERSAAITATRARWTLIAGAVVLAGLGAAGGALITRRAGRALDAERERRHAAIAEHERQMDAALSALEEGVWSMALPSRTLLYANPAARRLLPKLGDTPNGDAWTDAVHPDDLPLAHGLIQDALIEGAAEAELRVLASGQAERWLRLRAYVTSDHAGQPARLDAVAIDVTEHRRAQEALFNVQRLELVGQLVSTVVHDFNNMLTVISGFADMALRELEEGSVAHESIREVQAAGERATALARQLLAAARPEPPILRPIDVCAMVREMRPLLRRAVPESIELSVETAAEPCVVRADRRQVEQAVLNLVMNARDAVGSSGAIHVEAGRARSPGVRDVAVGRLEARDYVVVRVRDTGAGIDPAVLPGIFEPFFTTKPLGRGTGLGLSSVRSLMERMGGAVVVQTTPGAGSTFELFFPAHTAAPADLIAPRHDAPRPGTETVLIIEDDRQVRDVAASALDRLGYRVVEAFSIAEAIRLCREASPALILTDLTMQTMSGLDVARACRRERPEIAIVFTTGYFDRESEERVAEFGAALIRKPFLPEELARAVRAALDTPESPQST